jgi:hypothetical protein
MSENCTAWLLGCIVLYCIVCYLARLSHLAQCTTTCISVSHSDNAL